jgi:2-phospho-L-lactate guanylyltransferase
MQFVVPFAAERPKTRLADVLGQAERRGFARAMLRDVLDAIRGAGHEPQVLATAPVSVAAPVTVDERPLSEAVNARIEATVAERGSPLGVAMADLALATPAAVGRLCSSTGGVVIAPGRGGGTNALVVTEPSFRVDYHGISFRDHVRAADEAGAAVARVDSMRLATDVDEPPDLVEVLLHADGRACDWLREAGFELAVQDGRATVRRA